MGNERKPPEQYGILELIKHYREHREDDQILTVLSGMADEAPAEVVRALKLAGEDVTGLAGKQSRIPHMGKSRAKSPDPDRKTVKKAVRLREAGKKAGEVAKEAGMTVVQVQRIAEYAAEYGIEYTPPGMREKYDHLGIKRPGRKPKKKRGILP